MATKIICRGVPGGLMAVNKIEADQLDQFIGREVEVEIKIPRNLGLLRKFFAMLGVAFEMADHTLNKEQFRSICIAGSGYCDYVEYEGTLTAVPRSISFASMQEPEFENLYRDVLTFVCANWVLDREQLEIMLDFM